MWFIYLAEEAFDISKKERFLAAEIAQLGERQTEDLKVAGSIPALGVLFDFLVKYCSCPLFCCPITAPRVC
jgi:hypothetical protein